MNQINKEVTKQEMSEAIDLVLSNLDLLTTSQLNTVEFICQSELMDRDLREENNDL